MRISDRRLEFRCAHRHTGGGVGLGRVQSLSLEQRLGEAVELVAVFGQQLRDCPVRLLDNPLHLFVDEPLGLR